MQALMVGVIFVVITLIILSIIYKIYQKIKSNEKLNKLEEKVFLDRKELDEQEVDGFLKSALRISNAGLWSLGEVEEYIFFSKNVISILGINMDDIVIIDDKFYMHTDCMLKRYMIDENEKIVSFFKSYRTSEVEKFHWRYNCSDDRILTVCFSKSSILKDDKPINYGSVRDITKEEKYERELKHKITYDALTGAKNRNEIFYINTDELKAKAMCYINLNSFKQINDAFGHDIGDKILITVVNSIYKYHESIDVYRMGGDEFLITLKNSSKTIAKKLLEIISAPIIFDNYKINISSSMGMLEINEHYCDIEKNINIIDFAMREAKKEGKNSYVIVNDKVLGKFNRQLEIDNLLPLAIKNKELVSFFQPYIDSETGKVKGFETLVRWFHEDKTFYPDEFLPSATKNGLIYDIDMQMLENATKFLSKLKKDKLVEDNFIVTSNFSAESLVRVEPRNIFDILKKYDVKPDEVIIELTEQLLVNEKAFSNIVILKNAGISIAIDDFSAGHSSLKQLKDLDFDILKIDKALIDDLYENPKNSIIYKTVVGLGFALKVKIVSEGVETKEQRDFLEGIGIKFIQGYYYHKPMPETEIIELIKNN